MGMVKMINYVRSEVKTGNIPDLSINVAFQDEKYLKPVLEDDAVLYNLHDIIDEGFDEDKGTPSNGCNDTDDQGSGQYECRIKELEDKLLHTQQELDARRRELEAIRAQFGTSQYEESTDHVNPSNPTAYDEQLPELMAGTGTIRNGVKIAKNDTSYFDSYSNYGM